MNYKIKLDSHPAAASEPETGRQRMNIADVYEKDLVIKVFLIE